MKSLKALLALSVSAILLFSCKKDDQVVDQDQLESYPGGIVSQQTISSSATATPINKTVLLQMVNDARAKGCNCGTTYMPPVAPLVWNTQLETAAYNHSNDMFTRNYFSHYSPEGTTAGTRASAAGYRWRALGENIAKGYPTESAVITAWLKSSGHCRNIMNSRFKDMGISRVGSYWTQVLGSKY